MKINQKVDPCMYTWQDFAFQLFISFDVCIGRVSRKRVICRRKTMLELWKKINEIPPCTQMVGLDDAIIYLGNSKKVVAYVCIILVNYVSFYNLKSCPWYYLQDLSEGFTEPVAMYHQCFPCCVVVNRCTCPCKVWQAFCFYCEDKAAIPGGY